jgi:hypothetical protein
MNKIALLGIPLILAAIGVLGVYLHYYSPAEPTLEMKVAIGDLSKFGANATCANTVIPYFVNLSFDRRKITDADVYARLMDAEGKDVGTIQLYYDSYREIWTSAVMYPCLPFGNYRVLANATAIVDGRELYATDMIEISV